LCTIVTPADTQKSFNQYHRADRIKLEDTGLKDTGAVRLGDGFAHLEEIAFKTDFRHGL
jgi:hypothetical protein